MKALFRPRALECRSLVVRVQLTVIRTPVVFTYYVGCLCPTRYVFFFLPSRKRFSHRSDTRVPRPIGLHPCHQPPAAQHDRRFWVAVGWGPKSVQQFRPGKGAPASLLFQCELGSQICKRARSCVCTPRGRFVFVSKGRSCLSASEVVASRQSVRRQQAEWRN